MFALSSNPIASSRFAMALPRLDWNAQRRGRMTCLLGVVCALSAVDLALTVHQVSTVGMFEDNPLARALVGTTGSVLPLVALKLLSVGASVGLLAALRRHWQAEIGAWIAAGVLTWLTVQWCAYIQAMQGVDMASMREIAAASGWLCVPE